MTAMYLGMIPRGIWGTMLKSCHISTDRLYRKFMAVKYLTS
jgi:hypothetical protein